MPTTAAVNAQTPPNSEPAASAPPSSDTLQTFTLDDLAQYTHEGAFGPTASPDFRVFYVGRDDVHGVLVHLFTRVRLSVKMNMFGFDDDQLNQILMGLVMEPTVMVQLTLDKSQATSVAHEKMILSSDAAKDPAGYAVDFAIGTSDTGQISHTKGGVLDGVVAFEGSTNWSTSGEGVGIDLSATTQQAGFKAQNNTLAVYVNPYEIAKFSARLDYEHGVAAHQPQPAAGNSQPSTTKKKMEPVRHGRDPATSATGGRRKR